MTTRRRATRTLQPESAPRPTPEPQDSRTESPPTAIGVRYEGRRPDKAEVREGAVAGRIRGHLQRITATRAAMGTLGQEEKRLRRQGGTAIRSNRAPCFARPMFEIPSRSRGSAGVVEHRRATCRPWTRGVPAEWPLRPEARSGGRPNYRCSPGPDVGDRYDRCRVLQKTAGVEGFKPVGGTGSGPQSPECSKDSSKSARGELRMERHSKRPSPDIGPPLTNPTVGCVWGARSRIAGVAHARPELRPTGSGPDKGAQSSDSGDVLCFRLRLWQRGRRRGPRDLERRPRSKAEAGNSECVAQVPALSALFQATTHIPLIKLRAEPERPPMIDIAQRATFSIADRDLRLATLTNLFVGRACTRGLAPPPRKQPPVKFRFLRRSTHGQSHITWAALLGGVWSGREGLCRARGRKYGDTINTKKNAHGRHNRHNVRAQPRYGTVVLATPRRCACIATDARESATAPRHLRPCSAVFSERGPLTPQTHPQFFARAVSLCDPPSPHGRRAVEQVRSSGR